MPRYAPRLLVDPFVRFVLFSATGEGTFEVLLQGGNAQLPSSLITLLCYSIIVLY